MRRKRGVLLPIEVSILGAIVELQTQRGGGAHGFLVAKRIHDREGARLLIAHGTLYKALGRMEKAGLLASEWEDPLLAAAEQRPRRRPYRVTAKGVQALAAIPERAEAPAPASQQPRTAPS